MKGRRVTFVLAAVTLGVLVLASPGALREALERGEFYVFTSRFLEDIPRRLAGPGRFRFIVQPTLATLLGWRDGVADARAGRSPYLSALASGAGTRGELVKSGLSVIANLLLMGILLDSVFQWVILGAVYPAAALVVGPVLIACPYAVARALANRVARALWRG